MRTNSLLPVLLPLTLALSACGGGGGTSTPVVTPTPPTATGPASTAAADLIAYAMDGGTTSTAGYNANWRVTRTTKSETVNGQSVTVTVDHLPGGEYGLISYRQGADLTFYTLDDGLVANANLPSASYGGTWDTNYRINGGDNWIVGDGDFGLTVNMSTGAVAYGGMSSAADGSSSVEYYGNTTVSNGVFADDAAAVVLRENGAFTNETVGSLSGMLVGSGSDAAAVGLTDAIDASIGFEMHGGFSSPYSLTSN